MKKKPEGLTFTEAFIVKDLNILFWQTGPEEAAVMVVMETMEVMEVIMKVEETMMMVLMEVLLFVL